ncbi:unnamed protein product, partial [marine sediment metagenome]
VRESWHAWKLGATGIGFWGYIDNKPTRLLLGQLQVRRDELLAGLCR